MRGHESTFFVKRAIRHSLLASLIAVGCWPIAPASGAEANEEANKAIRAAAQLFVEAFNHGDAKQLSELWTVGGSLADEQGELVKGRQAIEAKYAALFKESPGAKIEVTINSIEFPTPTVAIEDGVSRITTQSAAPPGASQYTAVHTLENGKWLMSSVREASIPTPSNFVRLRQLQWLIGKWRAKSNDLSFDVQFRWIANSSFIQREDVVTRNGVVVQTAVQVIGWDPQSSRLRSWTFESPGGYGTGYWWSTPEGWRIQCSGVRADGAPASSIDSLIRVAGENDVLGWRSIDRKIGGVSYPNLPELVFDRVQEKN